MFESLKLIKPFWYFHKIDCKNTKWPNPATFDNDITIDKYYDSNNSAVIDSSFQLLARGWIPNNNFHENLTISSLNYKPSLADEFRFIKKYFHSLWVPVFFFYCIFTLKNPLKTLRGYLRSLHIKRQKLFDNPIAPLKLENNVDQEFVLNKIKVRIIIPTLNRYKSLKDLLRDLELQDHQYFAVTVIDQSNPYSEDFYKDYNLDLKLIRQSNPGLWKARNNAIISSEEKIIALLDDDSRLESDWLTKHLNCLEYYNVKISAGVSLSSHGASIPLNYKFYRISDQLDTGNVVINREVFNKCNLFDEQFEGMRMGDGEFGLRAYINNIIAISNPEAKRIHLKIKTGGLRKMGSWDALRPKGYFDPRPIPSVLYLSRKYFGIKRSFLYLFVNIPISLTSYKNKDKNIYYIISLIIFFTFSPLIILQVVRSWKISSKMLKKGPKVRKIV